MGRMKKNRRFNPLEGEFDLGGIRGPETDEDVQAAGSIPAYVQMVEPKPERAAALPTPVYVEEDEETHEASESNGALYFLLVAGGLAAAWYWWSGKSTAEAAPVVTAEDEVEEEEDLPTAEPAPEAKAPVAPRATAPGRKFEPFRPRVGVAPVQADPRTSIPGTRMDPRPPFGKR